jgi:hypothetical protein
MRVCRAWRRAATQCSPLWSTLYIQCHSDPLERHTCRRFRCKDHILSTPMAVHKAIRRSRGGLLDIHLVLHYGRNSCMQCFRSCLDVIGGSLLERWRSLSFAIGERAEIDLGPMFTGSLSNLRSVCFQNYSPTLIAALASSAPLLHTIEFAGFGPHNFARYIGQKFWPRTRKLVLKSAWCGFNQFKDLSRLLTSCRALHSLELDNSHVASSVGPPLPSLWPPDVPSLTRMKCNLQLPAWSLLSGMTITVLFIAIPLNRFSYDRETRGISKIFLPNLKRLTCEGSAATLCASRLFDAPSLVDLALIKLAGINFEDLGNTYSNDIWTHLSNVSLHWKYTPSDGELRSFLGLLRHHREIRSLTLRGIPLSAKIFTKPHIHMLCPRLNSVAWWLVPDMDNVEEVQKQFYEDARKCIGGPNTNWRVERISLSENYEAVMEEWD